MHGSQSVPRTYDREIKMGKPIKLQDLIGRKITQLFMNVNPNISEICLYCQQKKIGIDDFLIELDNQYGYVCIKCFFKMLMSIKK